MQPYYLRPHSHWRQSRSLTSRMVFCQKLFRQTIAPFTIRPLGRLVLHSFLGNRPLAMKLLLRIQTLRWWNGSNPNLEEIVIGPAQVNSHRSKKQTDVAPTPVSVDSHIPNPLQNPSYKQKIKGHDLVFANPHHNRIAQQSQRQMPSHATEQHKSVSTNTNHQPSTPSSLTPTSEISTTMESGSVTDTSQRSQVETGARLPQPPAGVRADPTSPANSEPVAAQDSDFVDSEPTKLDPKYAQQTQQYVSSQDFHQDSLHHSDPGLHSSIPDEKGNRWKPKHIAWENTYPSPTVGTWWDQTANVTFSAPVRSAARAFSSSRSIPRKPRIFPRICTLAWLSNSSIGLAKSRKKWLLQYRCGTPGHTLAMVGLLLVGHPQPHTATQPFGPVFGLYDEWANFRRRARQQRSREPDALASQFSHHVKCLVPFLRLQTINR